jgi:hypothetical protein
VGQNFFEAEGFGVPDDLLTNPAWNSFVFVSTLRHPLDRIESSLRADHRYHACREANSTSQRSCLHRFVASEEAILKHCDHAIYHCLSNYYVCMFSDMDYQTYTTDKDMLQKAKRNFWRFSCVFLQEAWDETVPCLPHKLGLHVQNPAKFNILGRLSALGNNTVVVPKSDERQSVLFAEDLSRLEALNQVDLEFFEWAKEIILSKASGYDDSNR